MKVRFGVMIVGPTMSGKSKCLDILRKSYINLNENFLKENKENNHKEF